MPTTAKLEQVNNTIQTLSDLLQGLTPEQLSVIASGKVNMEALASSELNKRGLNSKGQWVGYGK